jgi:hypothetical protein
MECANIQLISAVVLAPQGISVFTTLDDNGKAGPSLATGAEVSGFVTVGDVIATPFSPDFRHTRNEIVGRHEVVRSIFQQTR